MVNIDTPVTLYELAPPDQTACEEWKEKYEASLERALRGVRDADRRIGLANLFWLAHSQQVAATLGYTDVAAFSRQFRRYAGHAPSDLGRD